MKLFYLALITKMLEYTYDPVTFRHLLTSWGCIICYYYQSASSETHGRKSLEVCNYGCISVSKVMDAVFFGTPTIPRWMAGLIPATFPAD